MNYFRDALFVFFYVAFVSSCRAVDATDYIIPEACRTNQEIVLDGSTMNGSTLTYYNTQKITVKFYFIPSKIVGITILAAKSCNSAFYEEDGARSDYKSSRVIALLSSDILRIACRQQVSLVIFKRFRRED
ncbi:unnamed protein product [Calicophoron daubneyi]|uniref:Uncharacterized protein n=1 Tax=Calicophoron daubneyi TaxID=300641 RepID=A0AAV2TNK0_CALDB